MAQILIVEDEPVLRDMIAALIEDIGMGFQALTAANGCEALQLLAGQPKPPQLIITDVMMPCMGGVELLRALQSDASWQHVPVVFMSAAGPPRDAAEVPFLHKPFDLDALTALILHHLGDERTA
jgi:CheY-like chemotaxis protein